MELQPPFFVIAEDDKSIDKIDSYKVLIKYYEQIDIEAGLYSGWDINGYPFKLLWDSKVGPEIEVLEEKSQIELLRNAIKDYARACRPEPLFDCSDSNVVALFKAAEEHINKGKLWCKLSNWFKNLRNK